MYVCVVRLGCVFVWLCGEGRLCVCVCVVVFVCGEARLCYE